MNIQITERDCQLFRWINRCGFVTAYHVAEHLHIQPVTAYQRLQKLTTHQYLKYQKIIHGHGIYSVCTRGIKIADSPLPPLHRVPLAGYHHHLIAITLLTRLQRHWGGDYLTERELRHQYGKKCIGLKKHFSDGDLILNYQRIAIEVELTPKSQFRRDKIFHHYLKDNRYDQVWYFCGYPRILKQMQAYQKRAAWLMLYDLNESLQHPEKVHVQTQ